MYQPEIEDLKFQIHEIKKQNLELRSENHLFKVKIRKLNDELNKKNKQLDLMIDPIKNGNITKVLSKHGATLIMRLKDENFAVHKKLAEKELHIKKLQSELQTAKLYVNEKVRITSPSLKLLENQEILQKVHTLYADSYISPTATVKSNIRKRSRSVTSKKKTKSRSASPSISESATDLKKNYMILLNNNLQKIKQFGSLHSTNENNSNPSCHSASSNKADKPHEEIQQLQGHLLNLLTEVHSLKDTINQLQKDQNKITSNIGESRNDNQIKPVGTGSETIELLSIGSSKCSTCDYTGDSEYNESTDGSIFEIKPTSRQNKNIDEEKINTCKSISIQTARSFCSRTFSPVQSKKEISMKNEKTDVDEYDIEIEYIN